MKPYVYIIQNLERTHWYVGMRSANECPANEDTKYWGSSKYLKKLIKKTGKENWTKTVISEFDDAEIAHEFEQMLLEFMWHLPGRVNKARSGFVDHSDPEVNAKRIAGIVKAYQDPEVKAAHQKAMASPEYIANHKAGCKVGAQKRSEDPEYRAIVNTANQKSGPKRRKSFIATNIITGEEFFCESLCCDQAKTLGLNQGNVSSCLNGKREQNKGFTFRYV